MPSYNSHPFFDIFDAINGELSRHYGPNNAYAKCAARDRSTAAYAPAAASPEPEASFVPAIDVFDTDRSFVIHASLPGASPNAISVDYEPKTNEIVLTGEVKRSGLFADSEISSKSLRIGERNIGKFERRIRLPSTAKIVSENITAKLANGVLEIAAPKVEEQPKKKIVIETVTNPTDDWIDAAEDSEKHSASNSKSIQLESLD